MKKILKLVGLIVFICLFLLMAYHIVNFEYRKFQSQTVTQAYFNGSQATIVEVAKQSNDCTKPVEITIGETKYQLINIACLQQVAQAEESK